MHSIKANLRIKKLRPDVRIPSRATAGSSGFDVHADIPDGQLTIWPGERKLVSTGLAVEIEPGFELVLRPRSGLAIQTGLTIINSPGTIDADYRGEVRVPMVNHGEEPVRIEHGERIAQWVLQILPTVEICIVEGDLSNTARGEQGFGSTGP